MCRGSGAVSQGRNPDLVEHIEVAPHARRLGLRGTWRWFIERGAMRVGDGLSKAIDVLGFVTRTEVIELNAGVEADAGQDLLDLFACGQRILTRY